MQIFQASPRHGLFGTVVETEHVMDVCHTTSSGDYAVDVFSFSAWPALRVASMTQIALKNGSMRIAALLFARHRNWHLWYFALRSFRAFFQDAMLVVKYSRSCVRFVGSTALNVWCCEWSGMSNFADASHAPSISPACSTSVHNRGDAQNRKVLELGQPQHSRGAWVPVARCRRRCDEF